MIALAGPNLPHELLAAAGKHGGAIALGLDQPTPRAQQWLESKFAPHAFALVESWAAGAYDHLDAVLFSRADDTSQRLYYYLCELQRRGLLAGPRPLIFDVGKIPRTSSRDLTVAAVRRLAGELGVGDAALEAAIVAGNRARAGQPGGSPSGPVCLLHGTPPPDRRLHQVIEAAGFAASGLTMEELWLSPGPAVAEGTGDPAAALGTQLHARQQGARSFADPAAFIRQSVETAGASAVVLWRIEEDEAQTWQFPAEQRALAELGLPTLVLTRTDWQARDGAPAAIAEFLAGVAR
ncbi:2-hydroxyacyl-CoA dehydratase [Alteraurantiacibacter buctensis]|uniref:2-hydroxyacyl-CoA dehydratase n=1 Tax=Alteraurantiacibacter buctensis TaxID=1503981 RepID=A0A844YXL8_9SPHN|nr:hypothetical protein [Alteraurantiacibacter buctensis]